MALAEKLSERREYERDTIPAETRDKMHRAVEELRESGIMDRALNVGDKIPSFSLANTKGEKVSSDQLLKEGNLVVTFYRGVW